MNVIDLKSGVTNLFETESYFWYRLMRRATSLIYTLLK